MAASAGRADAHATCNKFASTSGSDRSGDGSFAHPYATPQKLVDSLSAGQRGCFRRGTYNFSITEVSSPNITLAPHDHESVTLNGTLKFLPSSAGSAIRRLKLDYHNRTDAGGGSPRIYADDVLLRHNDITSDHTGICVMVGSYYNDPPPQHVRIARNRIHDCGRLPPRNHEHGIYLSESRGAIVRSNWIYGNADRGIQLYPDAQDSTIAGNVIYGNGEGQNFSCDSSTCSTENVVKGNIITSSETRWNVYGHSQGATPDGSNVLRDNCLYAPGTGYAGNGGVDLDRRFFSVSGNLIAKPHFADPAHGDFRLRGGDPCLSKYTGWVAGVPRRP